MKTSAPPKPKFTYPKIILSLGNPGKEYSSTYHNAGHLFIDYLLKKSYLSQSTLSKPTPNLICYKSKNQLICQSLTFMNVSGLALKDAFKIHKFKPEEILIVQDDSDISLGSYKLSIDKNSAGHKGIESIIKTLSSKKFWRLRIGIRPSKEKARVKAESFVLKKINPTNKKILYSMFAGIIEKVIEKDTP